MTSVCALFLTALYFGQADEKTHVPNLLSLIQNEWSSQTFWDRRVPNERRFDDFGTRVRMLSLRLDPEAEEPTVAAGMAWLWDLSMSAEYTGGHLHPTKGNVQPIGYASQLHVYKGVYNLYRAKENSLLLKIAFTRCYRFSDGSATWSVDTRWSAEGAELLLPLDDAGGLPNDEIQLILERYYYVDNQGRETIRRNDPDTFTEKILGEGSIRSLTFSSIASAGEVIRLQKREEFREDFEDNPPPTFRFRRLPSQERTEIRVSAAKPVIESPSPETSSQLMEKAKEALRKKEFDRTILLCSTVIELSPSAVDAYRYRGAAYDNTSDYVRAGKDFTSALRLNPSDDWATWRRAAMYEKIRRYQLAVQDLKKAIVLKPDKVEYLNHLAWILATCPDSAVRDGALAYVYARKACELTEYKEPMYVDTLAASCAECGEYSLAARWQTSAIAAAPAQWKNEAQVRLQLYQSGQPYRAGK